METRVGILEVKVESLDKRVEHLESKSDEFNKFSVLLEILVEEQKETKKQTQQQAETMMLINNNMSHMNESLKNHGNRLESLENKQDDIQNSSKIDIIAILKNVAIAGLTAAILWLWGLS